MTRAADAIEATLQQKIVPVIRSGDIETARAQCLAFVDAGYRVLEVTLTTPGSIDLIESFASDSRLVLGAGSVFTQNDAERAINGGVSFLVSPINPEWFVEFAHGRGVAAMPGAATPSEAFRATEAGADIVKIFPAQRLGGPDFIRDLLAPMPKLALMATGGIPVRSAGDYLGAGCCAVGLGSILTDPELGPDMPSRARAALALADAGFLV